MKPGRTKRGREGGREGAQWTRGENLMRCRTSTAGTCTLPLMASSSSSWKKSNVGIMSSPSASSPSGPSPSAPSSRGRAEMSPSAPGSTA